MHVYRTLDGTTQALSFPYVVVGEAIFIILGGDLSRELQCDR